MRRMVTAAGRPGPRSPLEESTGGELTRPPSRVRSAAGFRLVPGDHIRRNAAPIGQLDLLAPGPLANRLVLRAIRCLARSGPAAAPAGADGQATSRLAARVDVRPQGGAHFRGVPL